MRWPGHAVVLVATLPLFLVGCGGDRQRGRGEASETEGRSPAERGNRGEEQIGERGRAGKLEATRRGAERNAGRGGRRVSSPSIRWQAEAVLASLGFNRSEVRVGAGRRMIVLLDPRSACAARPKDALAIEEQIKRVAEPIREVIVEVGGRGLSLGDHLRAHCSRRTTGHRRGRLVYQKRDEGRADTPTLKLRSPRWWIEYENYGALLQIFVFRDGTLRGPPIMVEGRGRGRKTMRGEGRFRLKIVGTAEWTVRVRSAD